MLKNQTNHKSDDVEKTKRCNFCDILERAGAVIDQNEIEP